MARGLPKKYCNFCGLEAEDVIRAVGPGSASEQPTDGWYRLIGPMIPGQPIPEYDWCSAEHRDLDEDPTSVRPAPVNPLPEGLNRPRPPKGRGPQA